MSARQRLLLVEDNPDDALLFAGTFNPDAYAIEHVGSLAQAAAALRRAPPDIILLDLGLPDSSGLATLESLLPVAANVPIAVLTGLDDEQLALDAVRAGAQDYLFKGHADSRTVTRILRHAVERQRQRVALEEARRAESVRATHDPLTGLANRIMFQDRLKHLVARALRYRESFAVGFIDLDEFKPINDRYGHDVGDEILVQFAARLGAQTRDSDTLARLGGDEFVVLMERVENRFDAERHLRGAVDVATASLSVGDTTLALRASWGIALYPEDGLDGAELLRAADAAMYHQKACRRQSR